MDLEYSFCTGSINEVKESLIRSVGQYIRHYSKVKIGITNNPSKRQGEHARSRTKWNKMVVKYKTSSVNFINQIEKIVIDYHWDYIENEIGGGGGPDGEAPYYLYVLLKWEINGYQQSVKNNGELIESKEVINCISEILSIEWEDFQR